MFTTALSVTSLAEEQHLYNLSVFMVKISLIIKL